MTAEQLANLDDEQAMRLEGNAREFYKRVLILMNDTGCPVAMAIQAVEQADSNEA